MEFVILKLKQKWKNVEKLNSLSLINHTQVYIADITGIPIEIRENTNYLYLLKIWDNFTKYTNSFLLSNKNQNIILFCIKYFIENVEEPTEMGFIGNFQFIQFLHI